jgi:hypothetical protein
MERKTRSKDITFLSSSPVGKIQQIDSAASNAGGGHCLATFHLPPLKRDL